MDVRVRGERVRGERERLEGGVEVGYAVLGEKANEVEPANGIFAR